MTPLKQLRDRVTVLQASASGKWNDMLAAVLSDLLRELDRRDEAKPDPTASAYELGHAPVAWAYELAYGVRQDDGTFADYRHKVSFEPPPPARTSAMCARSTRCCHDP